MARTEHAVVIGGSVAGLCAARALADRFGRVTVIDRDVFPSDAQHRKGVPQSRHPHALLDGGRRELEKLFPGFAKESLARGALDLDPGKEMATMRADGWAPSRSSPRRLLFASRVLIESVIRDAVAPIDNIELVEGTDVTGLLAREASAALGGARSETKASGGGWRAAARAPDPAGQGGLRVRGVRTRSREGGETGEVAAELVVDASGRASRAADWLAELGLPAPGMTVVDANAGYSTRWYQGPSAADRPADWWWKSLWIEPLIEDAAREEERYFGLLFPIEGDRWIVTTASWGGRELATDPESFERMISKLRTPILAEAIGRAEPISPVYHRRSMQNAWRHYETWPADLPGFIATGDAVCGFNPVYGQGITVAAFCANILRRCLDQEDPRRSDFPRLFFREQAKFLEVPWMMATSRDEQQARIEGDGGEPLEAVRAAPRGVLHEPGGARRGARPGRQPGSVRRDQPRSTALRPDARPPPRGPRAVGTAAAVGRARAGRQRHDPGLAARAGHDLSARTRTEENPP